MSKTKLKKNVKRTLACQNDFGKHTTEPYFNGLVIYGYLKSLENSLTKLNVLLNPWY